MTEIVVLIKLVPDIRHIPEDAWDLQRGTLRRNRLQLIPNPYDDRALELAFRIRKAWGGRVTALSMGPPEAADICSRSLAFGADRAVLVCDPACAGSDTLATSVVLARAIQRVSPEPGVLLVITGMQSPDGDTAQVPIQVASRLGAAVVPYVTSARTSHNEVEISSIGSAGAVRNTVTPSALPLVVTCTEQLPSLPFHTTLRHLEHAASHELDVLTAADLGLSPDEIGLVGSATRVVTISVADSVRRDGTVIDWTSHGDFPHLAARIADHIGAALSADANAAGSEATPRNTGDAAPTATPGRSDNPGSGATLGDAGKSGPARAVWAVVEPGTGPHRLGILAHARRIAGVMGCPTVACMVGTDVTRHADSRLLGEAGATMVLGIEVPVRPGMIATALALEQAVAEFGPRIVLLPASPEGRVTAPYLAARIGAGLTADCTSFTVKDFTSRREGMRRTYRNALYQRRPALGGNIEATIIAPRNIERGVPQMATVRPGPTVPHAVPGPVPTHRFVVRLEDEEGPHGTTESRDAQAPETGIEIERCKVLVSVGRGAGGADGISELAEPLAEAIRTRFNVEVEVSGSRMVVDAGDLTRERQVGQTGKTVTPDLYIALGISGAVQHRAGMEGSASILAVNVDADAPIRRLSDLFVCGRVQEVVPALIAALTA